MYGKRISPKDSSASSRLYYEDDYYDTNSTIETSPASEIKRIEEIILNLFTFAKTEIANIYNSVYNEMVHLKKLTKRINNRDQ